MLQYENQWGRVMDVVLQYEVHREGVDPPLLSGEVINVDQSKLGCPPTVNIIYSYMSHDNDQGACSHHN